MLEIDRKRKNISIYQIDMFSHSYNYKFFCKYQKLQKVVHVGKVNSYK